MDYSYDNEAKAVDGDVDDEDVTTGDDTSDPDYGDFYDYNYDQASISRSNIRKRIFRKDYPFYEFGYNIFIALNFHEAAVCKNILLMNNIRFALKTA